MFRLFNALSAAAIASAAVLSSATGEPPAAAERRWSGDHVAFGGGEMLDPAWFAGRRAVVYLLPDGDMLAVRRAAASIMRDRWTEGDWSLKHVFVSDVGNRFRFAARQRLAVHAIATDVTTEAGQGPEFIPENEDFVRQNVFFVCDPGGSLWRELLGTPEAGTRVPSVVLLDYGGRVVKSVEPQRPEEAPAADLVSVAADPLAADVRKLLPMRPDMEK
jgi:hypothetical protein